MREIQGVPADCDLIGYVRACWPNISITEATVIAMALEKCPENAAVRINWEPIKDLRYHSEEGKKLKVTRQVPAAFGIEE